MLHLFAQIIWACAHWLCIFAQHTHMIVNRATPPYWQQSQKSVQALLSVFVRTPGVLTTFVFKQPDHLLNWPNFQTGHIFIWRNNNSVYCTWTCFRGFSVDLHDLDFKNTQTGSQLLQDWTLREEDKLIFLNVIWETYFLIIFFIKKAIAKTICL